VVETAWVRVKEMGAISGRKMLPATSIPAPGYDIINLFAYGVLDLYSSDA
jgi:hypothetical protein